MTSRRGVAKIFRASLWLVVAILCACASVNPSHPGGKAALDAEDPLPAWSDTAVKRTILDYVAEVTRRGGPGYISPQHRLATFDFDGTLGCEKPEYMEVMVAMRRLCELTETEPALLAGKLYRAACDGDFELINDNVEEALLKAFLGETQGFYVDYVKEFINTRRHPHFDRPYADLYYVPMPSSSSCYTPTDSPSTSSPGPSRGSPGATGPTCWASRRPV